MTSSFSAHISDGAREKLKAYKEAFDCRNNSETLEHIVEHMKVPEPKKKPTEPDPNQTTLTEHES